ncbi:MAG: OB-fold-containig protein [Candidimonas sp.]
MDFFDIAANVVPYSTFGILVGFLVVDTLCLLMGASISSFIDGSMDADVDVDVDVDMDVDVDVEPNIDVSPSWSFLSWLGLGKVPFMVLISTLMGFMTIAGIVGNYLLWSIGINPVWWFTLIFAIVGSIFPTGIVSAKIAKWFPKDHTSAIQITQLLGKVGKLHGNSTPELPAEMEIIDQHGQRHYVMVIPHKGEILPVGIDAVLVERKTDTLFTAIPLNK